MHFGRVENIEVVDFSLPKTHSFTEGVLKQLTKPEKPKVYLGCPVWANKGFVGKIYPNRTSSKNYLNEYCKQFNSIEVNATHYQIPNVGTIENWRKAAQLGFKFCPKFPQSISHRKDFYQKEPEIDLFLSRVYGLDEFLGVCLIQFPPHFKTDKLKQLELFFQKLPKDLSFTVELRHESWFEDDIIKKEWFDLFKKYNIIPTITDTAGRRDVLHQLLTNDKAFIRFVGNNLHATDYQRVDDWIHLFSEWIRKGVKEIYFFPHEPEKHLCADLLIYMIEQLNVKTGLEIAVPKKYTNNEGSLF